MKKRKAASLLESHEKKTGVYIVMLTRVPLRQPQTKVSHDRITQFIPQDMKPSQITRV